MRIKFGFVVGFSLGYYFGTAAGKERHEQLKRLISKVTNSGPVSTATDQAKAAADAQIHRAKDKVSHKLHRHTLGETTEFMPS